MSSRCREWAVVVTVALACGCARHAAPRAHAAQPAAPRRVLHVAADPNNLPFTNERLEGFENKIARVVADELGADVRYVWRAQRRGFFRHAFGDDGCEVVMGVPVGFDMAATTKPYYRSTYVFVSRADRKLNLTSFDDPRLRGMKIGIHVLGDADEGSATPAGLALARRGLANNLVGYTVYGDYRQPNPTARLVEAVAAGEVDVAVVWGPVAGYFASRCGVPLDLASVTPAVEPPGLKFAFGISVGVRRGDAALKEELEAALERRRAEIEKILDDYGVPRAPAPDAATASTR
jgi:mxaJ protein